MPSRSDQTDVPADGPVRNVAAGLVPAVIGIVTVAAMVMVAYAHWSDPISALALGGLVAVAGWLSVIDVEHHRLPNRIVGPLAAAVTLAVVLSGLLGDDISRSGQAMLFGLAAAGFFLVGNVVGGMGMGDVKYAYPLGTTLGWFGAQALTTALLVTVLIGGLAAIVVLLSGRGRRYRLPYGPFMSVGLVAGLLVAPGL